MQVKRRDFIKAIASSAAAWPLAARAQQRPRVPTIGFLSSGTPSSDSQYVAAFGQRMRALGWIEGRDVAIEYRWGEGRVDRFAELAAEVPLCANQKDASSKRRMPAWRPR
jgi:putative tryptophan/tyrosine transport system substrate-binding protein